MDNPLRQQVVREARSWIGTPYEHCADIKGVGVDCGMLIVRVFNDLGIHTVPDPRPYTPDWHMHRVEENYLMRVLAHGKVVETPQIGDVMLFKVGRCYSHGGIVSKLDPLTIIHASYPSRITLEEEISRSPDFMDRLESAKFLSPFGD